jgi:hypothetical protein
VRVLGNKIKSIIDISLGVYIPLCTPGIGAYNDTLLDLQVRLDPPKRTRLRIQIINRHIEETLYLTGMQIHRDDMIAPGRLQHIGNELRRDRRPGLVLLILPRVWEVRDHSRDAACTSCLASVYHDEQFHQTIVNLAWRSGLQYEHFQPRSISTILIHAKCLGNGCRNTVFITH